VLYAPFVKAVDKVRKDTAEMSFSDFQPKRFAVNYDPPLIVLEYMVPSTGKLYHHKMRLKNLTKQTKISDMMNYLEQRHPLYFMSPNLKKDQVRKLVEQIQYKMKPDKKSEAEKPAEKPKVPLKQKEDLGNLQKPSLSTAAQPAATSNFPPFKSGSALPSVSDFGKENKKQPEPQYDEEYYDEEEGSDFDANELLDMTDYKNKRGIPSPSDIANIQPKASNAKPAGSAFPAFSKPAPIATKQEPVKSSTQAAADEAFELDDDEDDGWGEDNYEDLKRFDYQNTDLNKMGDYQLNRHKQSMERDFSKNAVKPGDKGFEYDKRVDFSSQLQSN